MGKKKNEQIVVTEEIQNLEVGSVLQANTTTSNKKGKPGKKVKSTVTDTIPYINAYDNGVLQVDTGIFSRTYKFDDLSFLSASEEKQQSIFERYQNFLNALSPDIEMQLSFVNVKEDLDIKLSQICPPTRGDNLDKYRLELSRVLKDKLTSARNNIRTDKYITFTLKAESVDDAMAQFATLNDSVCVDFAEIADSTELELKPLSLAERLELLYKIYNGDKPNFYFEHDEKGKTTCDFTRLARQGRFTKDICSPEAFKFDAAAMSFGDRHCGHFFVDSLPNYLEGSFISSMCTLPIESVITVYVNQLVSEDATKIVNSQATNIDMEISAKVNKASEKGREAHIPTDLRLAKENIELLQEDMMDRDQKLFSFSMDIIYFGDDFEDLRKKEKVIRNTSAKYSVQLQKAYFMQEQCLHSTMPYGKHFEIHDRFLTTENVGIFIPFGEISQYDANGFYYGINRINHSPIIINRRKGMNYNALTLGSPGSGKSFSTKREMAFIHLTDSTASILAIDPAGEYGNLFVAFGGISIKIAPGCNNFINPLDLDIDNSFDIDYNPISAKVDFITGLVETINGRPLSAPERSVLDDAIHHIYDEYLEHLASLPPVNGKMVTIDREYCPTLQTLFQTLQQMKNEYAVNIAWIIQQFVTGSFNLFANHTNVDIDNKLVNFDVSSIGDGIFREVGIKVCLNEMFTRNQANRRKNCWTYMYIDEFHLFLSSPASSSYFKTIWKTCRKFWGCPCAITQNVEDFIQSPDARAIINNSSFATMMNQSMMDRNALSQLFGLTETDLKYMTNVKPGNGLIWTPKGTFPVEDNFPDDTELFKLFSTAPDKDAQNKKD